MATLNLREHRFSRVPKRIVLFDVKGLSFNHLAMMQLDSSGNTYLKLFSDEFSCQGQMWQWGLDTLIPESNDSFLSLISSEKNNKSQCLYERENKFFKELSELRMSSALLENQGRGLLSEKIAPDCKRKRDEFFQHTMLLARDVKSSPDTDSKDVFNYLTLPQDIKKMQNALIYKDSSCQLGKCSQSFSLIVKQLFEGFDQKQDRFFIMLRDFGLSELIQNSKSKEIDYKNYFSELKETIKLLINKANKDPDLLLVITSSESYTTPALPWMNQHLVKRFKSMSSPVYVKGARSENFCGQFHRDLFQYRLKSNTKSEGRILDFINPFSDDF